MPSGIEEPHRFEELADRLAAIGEELADLAMERLADASSAAGRGGQPDPRLAFDERRLTRARRAVEKAAALLRPENDDAPGR